MLAVVIGRAASLRLENNAVAIRVDRRVPSKLHRSPTRTYVPVSLQLYEYEHIERRLAGTWYLIAALRKLSTGVGRCVAPGSYWTSALWLLTLN